MFHNEFHLAETEEMNAKLQSIKIGFEKEPTCTLTEIEDLSPTSPSLEILNSSNEGITQPNHQTEVSLNLDEFDKPTPIYPIVPQPESSPRYLSFNK